MYVWDERKTTVNNPWKQGKWKNRFPEQRQNIPERVVKIFYNEEFDPGSGWTLATGLAHASRGAAWLKLASIDGDRRTGE